MACLSITGWILNIDRLKSIVDGWVSMKVNTAIGLLLCSIAVVLNIFGRSPRHRVARYGTLFFSGLAVLLAALTLAEYLTRRDFGIDQLFFHVSNLGVDTSSPGRMSPSTALCLALVGTALFINSTNAPERIRLSLLQALGAAAGFTATSALVGYFVSAFFAIQWWTYTGMAAHTALSFLLLSIGLICSAQMQKRTRWHLDWLTTGGFLIGILLIMLVGQTAYLQMNQLSRTSQWVAHRQEVLNELRKLRGATSSLESIQRGYIITGDESILSERPRLEADTSEALQIIRQLTSDNPLQIQNLALLSPLLKERIDWENSTISTRRHHGFQEAATMIDSGKGSQLRIRIQGLFTDMENQELFLLRHDVESSRLATTTAFLLLPLEIFLCLAVLFGGVFFLNAGTEERDSAAHDLRASLKDERDLRNAIDEHAIVAITDSQGKITFVNDKFCTISKYSQPELIGQDHRIINSGHHPREFFRDLWTTIAQGRVWKGEVKNRAKDGTFYWVDTTIVPFLGENGKPRQYIAIRADITERKQAEEEIMQLNATLEQRVAQRTMELQVANKELDSFCYSVSHDLRAPLRGIGGFAKILGEDYSSQLDDVGKNYLRRVQAAADRMSDLIDDLLKLSRVTREDVRLEQVNVSEIVQSITDGLKDADPARSAEFLIEPNVQTEADPRLLRVMLENLLNNAWKFTSKKPHTRIEFNASSRDGRQVFCVRDNGAGFDMNYASKLFGAFQRLHGVNDFPGTGIGLATVQRIAHRHGGEIWAEAALDQGAAFFFSLQSKPTSWNIN